MYWSVLCLRARGEGARERTREANELQLPTSELLSTSNPYIARDSVLWLLVNRHLPLSSETDPCASPRRAKGDEERYPAVQMTDFCKTTGTSDSYAANNSCNPLSRWPQTSSQKQLQLSLIPLLPLSPPSPPPSQSSP